MPCVLFFLPSPLVSACCDTAVGGGCMVLRGGATLFLVMVGRPFIADVGARVTADAPSRQLVPATRPAPPRERPYHVASDAR